MKYILASVFLVLTISCNNSDSKEKEQQAKIDSLTNEVNKRDEDKKKQENEKNKMDERNAVLSKATITDKKAKAALMGGLSDIHFNFSNGYGYKLEEVSLTVHYVKANGNDAHTENKILKDVEANASIPLTAPDYIPAGVRIEVSIETLRCKAIGLCYDKKIEAGVSNDPYRCN